MNKSPELQGLIDAARLTVQAADGSAVLRHALSCLAGALEEFEKAERPEFKQEWVQSDRDRTLCELAQRYHREAEAFDRTVCTGPIINGAIMPIHPSEVAAISGNAIKLRKRFMLEAEFVGISRAELSRAISRLG